MDEEAKVLSSDRIRTEGRQQYDPQEDGLHICPAGRQ